MKRTKRLRCAVGVILCLMLLGGNLPLHAKEEQIKISDKEYAIHFIDAISLFISNEKPISGEVGSKMFLTYTVEKVTKDNAIQSGVIGTTDNTAEFPYTDGQGRMYWQEGNLLFDEGYTYVFRFERTKAGFEYHCAKMKDDKVETIRFANATEKPAEEAYQYYGIWLGGKAGEDVTAVLNHVRCYDEKGTDLAISLGKPSATRQDKMNEFFDVHPVIDSSYSFSLDNTNTVAISNKYTTDSDVIYLEYEVENITQDDTYQQGIIASSVPAELYPHGADRGFLQVEIYEKGQVPTPLLHEGGQYFVCIIRKEDGFDGYVQRTVNNETELFTFQGKSGIYSPSYSHFSLWLGEGDECGVTADFKNVKCYDGEGRNLGVQLNQPKIQLSRKGSIEDYSKSQAVYYCKENNIMLRLEKEQIFIKDDGGVQSAGTYTIQDDADLYLLLEEGKEHYNYARLQLTDEEENIYKRLQNSVVTFVTGEETFQIEASADTGFRVVEPDHPTKKGHKFKGWFMGDETAFDFDTVVTDSITLYAMWEDGNGNTYLSVDSETVDVDLSMIVGSGLAAVILLGSIAGCVVIVRRKRYGSI